MFFLFKRRILSDSVIFVKESILKTQLSLLVTNSSLLFQVAHLNFGFQQSLLSLIFIFLFTFRRRKLYLPKNRCPYTHTRPGFLVSLVEIKFASFALVKRRLAQCKRLKQNLQKARMNSLTTLA